jgi:hypothetical protein
MDKLINKLQNGYKLCIAGLSLDCLKLAECDNFVGNVCYKCHDFKKRIYHRDYNKRAKERVKDVYSAFKVTKQDDDELANDLESEPDDE